MDLLPLFLELQSVHDNLRTIERDLSQLPPDLARLDQELRVANKRLADLEKAKLTNETQATTLAKELALALRLEEHARQSLKSTANKIQYTAAIRELDERERARANVARPLKEAEGRVQALGAELAELTSKQAELQAQFDELHRIFLSEHENQVVARETLSRRKLELEERLGSAETARFNRILQARQGRVVVPLENGTCGGCRTKIRLPIISELSEKPYLACEACQRILFDPRRP